MRTTFGRRCRVGWRMGWLKGIFGNGVGWRVLIAEFSRGIPLRNVV